MNIRKETALKLEKLKRIDKRIEEAENKDDHQDELQNEHDYEDQEEIFIPAQEQFYM